jgi:hypothetical protein
MRRFSSGVMPPRAFVGVRIILVIMFSMSLYLYSGDCFFQLLHVLPDTMQDCRMIVWREGSANPADLGKAHSSRLQTEPNFVAAVNIFLKSPCPKNISPYAPPLVQYLLHFNLDNATRRWNGGFVRLRLLHRADVANVNLRRWNGARDEPGRLDAVADGLVVLDQRFWRVHFNITFLYSPKNRTAKAVRFTSGYSATC